MRTFLAEATGNTFILADSLKSPFTEASVLHRILEIEDRDDALILSEPIYKDESLSVKYQILGRDKQFGEFCANGARAACAYLHQNYPGFSRYYLRTSQGEHALKYLGNDQYSVSLPNPKYDLNPMFIADANQFKREFDYDYVEMIEPHLVIKGDISESTLFSLGRDLNSKKDLFPKGININAWHELGNGELFVRTYERGVQRLTRSCGTGSLSCASIVNRSKLEIVTQGGGLTINRTKSGMELIGKASVIYEN